MTAEELATLLRAKKRHGYWHGYCPAHEDRSPSLSIREEDGRVFLRCFAGCDIEDILKVLNLSFRDLGSGSRGWQKRICVPKAIRACGKKEKKPLGPPEAIYRYTNECGDVVAEKIRYAGKAFLWRRRDGHEWIWKVDRQSLPLYRLHEVKRASHICIVEGEKDADCLRRMVKPNWAVTTAPNGAESWRREYSDFLQGKTVFLVPDTDGPGLKYAERIREEAKGIAKAMYFVSVAPYKDVSDYLKEHSKEELRRIFLRGTRWS